MAELKDQLQRDLTDAMRARDELRVASLRMALSAIATEGASGSQARDLGDEEVLAVLRREVRKRREAAEVYAAASRPELAAREIAEDEVLSAYLPSQLGDDELEKVVATALAASGASEMGPAMRAANEAVAGRAEGARVAALVRRLLAGTAH